MKLRDQEDVLKVFGYWNHENIIWSFSFFCYGDTFVG